MVEETLDTHTQFLSTSDQWTTYLLLGVLEKHLQALVRVSRSNWKKFQCQGHKWEIDG